MFKIQFEIENNLELPSICLADPYFGPTEKEVTVHEGEVAFFNYPILNDLNWFQKGNIAKSVSKIFLSCVCNNVLHNMTFSNHIFSVFLKSKLILTLEV